MNSKKIPKAKKLNKDEVIESLRKEIIRKNNEIEKLKTENQLLLKVSIKNAKRKIEESNNSTN